MGVFMNEPTACVCVCQGLGVEVDRERALQLYQAALRAEGQLEGDLAEMGDDTMAKIFDAKGKGFFAERDKQRDQEAGGSAPRRSEDEDGEPSPPPSTSLKAAPSG